MMASRLSWTSSRRCAWPRVWREVGRENNRRRWVCTSPGARRRPRPRLHAASYPGRNENRARSGAERGAERAGRCWMLAARARSHRVLRVATPVTGLMARGGCTRQNRTGAQTPVTSMSHHSVYHTRCCPFLDSSRCMHPHVTAGLADWLAGGLLQMAARAHARPPAAGAVTARTEWTSAWELSWDYSYSRIVLPCACASAHACPLSRLHNK